LTLFVVPTPIGNLEDITLRALRVLCEADLILCEDTRRTGQLLAHYEIKQELLAYHEHNEARLAPDLAERARKESLALVTDAGTPLVSDPGYRLVRACIENGAEVESLPGPSALTTALVASGPRSSSSSPRTGWRKHCPSFPASFRLRCAGSSRSCTRKYSVGRRLRPWITSPAKSRARSWS
jgi:16S rRNA C1402 (ribose-2'-O) methylase RsmI